MVRLDLPNWVTSMPPRTAPQPRPRPWWMPCSTPCEDERMSGGVLCAMYEQQAAHTAACVMPCMNSNGSTHQGFRNHEM